MPSKTESIAQLSLYWNRKRIFRVQLQRKWASLTPFQRENMRQTKAEPLLDAYWVWLEKLDLAASSKLEDSVTYAKNLLKEIFERFPGARQGGYLQQPS